MVELHSQVWIVDGLDLGLKVGSLSLLQPSLSLELGEEGWCGYWVLLNLKFGHPEKKIYIYFLSVFGKNKILKHCTKTTLS